MSFSLLWVNVLFVPDALITLSMAADVEAQIIYKCTWIMINRFIFVTESFHIQFFTFSVQIIVVEDLISE